MTVPTKTLDELVEHSFYAVINDNNQYFAGFNSTVGSADFVDSIFDSKLFTNKYEIKLRPTERLVEVVVHLGASNTVISEPFRPRFRPKQHEKHGN